MTIAAAFDRAHDYDRHAVVQAHAAARLAERIAGAPIASPARILEIGCGTGLLGAALIDRLPGATWRMTDIAPAMVARTAARFAGDPRVATAVMDGEHPVLDARFDLICSSLAMQWFGDLGAGLRRLRALLAPGGLLAFTTLAEGSFGEWRAAQEAGAGTHDYPSADALRSMGLTVSIEEYPARHDDARAFLHGLKAIGAGTPRPGHRPLSPPALRRAMARFEAAGAQATYMLATCICRGEASE